MFYCKRHKLILLAGNNLFSARGPTGKEALVQSAPRMAKRSASAPTAPAEASLRKIIAGLADVN